MSDHDHERGRSHDHGRSTNTRRRTTNKRGVGDLAMVIALALLLAVGGTLILRDLDRRAAARAAWARVGACGAVGTSDVVECRGVRLVTLQLPSRLAACQRMDPCVAPVNAEAANAFRAALAEIVDRGLGSHITRFETLNRRRCRDARTGDYIEGCISKHSYGIAVDVRAFGDNARWSQVLASEPGMRQVVEIFRKHGFGWGGDFGSNFDPQHFEWIPR